jgi:iron complex outermembrane receptor protein
MQSNDRRHSHLAAAIAFLLASTAAGAQDRDATPTIPAESGTATPEPMPASEGQMEEIVVTAQKREQRLEDVPLSIQAFSGTDMENANVNSIVDLPRLVPNLRIQRGSQTANVSLRVRGIGASGNTAVDPSVGTFVDGIYVPRPGALLASFNDIAGAEVLRGPQGTLFGRNATVGAILLRTADPEPELGGSVSAEAGSNGLQKYTGMINLPAGDRLAFRLAGLHESSDGIAKNELDGKEFSDFEADALRAGMTADLTDSLTWTVKFDYSKIGGDGLREFEILPETVTAANRARMTALFGGITPDLDDPFDRRSNQVTFGNVDDEQWGVVSDLSLDLANGYTLRLLSGYRDWENEQLDGDVLFAPRRFLGRTGTYDSTSQSHELQVISPLDQLFDGRFDFVGGLYYFQEDFEIGETLSMLEDLCNYLVPPAQRPACNASANKANATVMDFSQDATNYAVYAQGNYALTDTVTITLGARWTNDEKEGSFVQLLNNPFAGTLRAPENTDLKKDDDQFTYRAGLQWEPHGDLMTFATYSTGYKSGGFNSGAGAQALGQRRVFDKEESDNIEVGAKWTLLDGAARLNATLFRMELDNFQDRAFDGTSFTVLNAGDLRHQGVELDGDFAVTDAITLFGALAYLDSEFLSYPNASCLPYPAQVNPTCTQDLKGERSTFTPEWQGNFGAQFQGDLPFAGIGYSFRADASYVGEANVGTVNDGNPQTIQDSYTLLSARFSLLFGDRRNFSVSVYGDNLTDEGYCTAISATPNDSALGLRDPVSGGTVMRCTVAPPRVWGVEFKAKL